MVHQRYRKKIQNTNTLFYQTWQIGFYVLFSFLFLKTGSHITQASLQRTMWVGLAFNTWSSSLYTPRLYYKHVQPPPAQFAYSLLCVWMGCSGMHVHVKANVRYLIALHFGFLRLVFCVSILSVCMCLWRAEESIRYPELELQAVVSYYWEPNTDPLQEQ